MKLLNLRYLGMLIFLVILGFFTVYPLGLIIYGSFRSAAPGMPGYFTLKGYIEGFSDPTIIKALYNTFTLGIVRTLISSILATFFCWILIRTDTPFKGTLEILMWINFFIPLLPMAMGWILLLDPGYGLLNQWLKKLPFITGPVFLFHHVHLRCLDRHDPLLFHQLYQRPDEAPRSSCFGFLVLAPLDGSRPPLGRGPALGLFGGNPHLQGPVWDPLHFHHRHYYQPVADGCARDGRHHGPNQQRAGRIGQDVGG